MKSTLLNLQSNYFLAIALFVTAISFGQDQFDSNGNIIWNSAANSGYNSNIDLIGRDDNFSLNKKQNTGVSPAPFVTIGLGKIASSNATNTNTKVKLKAKLLFFFEKTYELPACHDCYSIEK